MDLAEAERRIGQRVAYRPWETSEKGVIKSVGKTYVYVLYDGERQSRATLPQDLEVEE